MFKLIFKDWSLMIEKYSIVMLIFFTLVILASGNFDLTSKINIILVYGAFLIPITSFTNDERQGTDIFLVSLPLTKSDLVLSKYVGLLLNLLIGMISVFIISKIGTFIGFTSWSFVDFNKLIKSAAGIIIMSSILFPVIFKFGYNKAKIFNMIVFISIFCFFNLIFSDNTSSSLVKLMNSPFISFGFFLLAGIMFYVSINISLKIYDLGKER
ncbi:ABC-2 transporter permease [Clostridium sediminicola]|uniref:ABC-2 transporter permease n=1 Tax=Clostridium sediminicola TaxID=3114879 RepID=UPI0031F2574E